MTLMTDAEILEQIVRPNAALAARRDESTFTSIKAQVASYRANAVAMLQAKGYKLIAETKVRRMWAKCLREEQEKINAESVDKP